MFRFGPEPAFLDQIEMISFGCALLVTNSDVMVSFLLDVTTFVDRLCLFLYCLYITNPYTGGGGGGAYFFYYKHG